MSLAVVRVAQQGCNVLVDAVAGSGKTTTILEICAVVKPKRCLVLTYNRRLCDETRERAALKSVTNAEISTYHAFARKCAGVPVKTDSQLEKALASPVQLECPRYDLVIVDEAQDMTPLYAALLRRVLRGHEGSAVIMGDRAQMINGYKGADHRFLTLSDRLYPGLGRWERVDMHETHRLTSENAGFLNAAFLGQPRLVARRAGQRPTYLVCDPYCAQHLDEVIRIAASFDPEDVFVLAPSLRSLGSPVRHLENRMVCQGIPVFVPTSDEEDLRDERLTQGKVLFSTFHQSKGLERRCAIVFGADASYFEFIKPNADRDACPNEIYVALSRARDRLVVVHNYRSGYMFPALADAVPAHADLRVLRAIAPAAKAPPAPRAEGDVTWLLRHAPRELLQKLLLHTQIRELRPARRELRLDSVSLQPSGLYETGSEITGIAVPVLYEHRVTGTSYVFPEILCHDNLGKLSKKQVERVRELNRAPRLRCSDALYLANCLQALNSGYLHGLRQRRRFHWLSDANAESMMDVLRESLGTPLDLRFEVGVHEEITPGFTLRGRVDVTNSGVPHELKCVQDLEPESHGLQAALYQWLMRDHRSAEECRLLNYRTGQMLGVRTLPGFGDALRELAQARLEAGDAPLLSDDEFVDAYRLASE